MSHIVAGSGEIADQQVSERAGVQVRPTMAPCAANAGTRQCGSVLSVSFFIERDQSKLSARRKVQGFCNPQSREKKEGGGGIRL